jgi:lipid A disaccharide synthetase
MGQGVDILILSNGPGEVTTWVRPVVKSLRQILGHDSTQVRISVILSPCPNATGKEVAIARSYPEVDRVQGAEHFSKFLLRGQTSENWDWREQGVVLFLGGDQFFTVVISKRLGYRSVTYAEWDARWWRWIDRFGVMKPELLNKVPQQYHAKFTVVGDLMADVAQGNACQSPPIQHFSLQYDQKNPLNPPCKGGLEEQISLPEQQIIGLLPGSKAAKLAQGLPLSLAIADYLHTQRPDTKFIIPVSPTLDLPALAKFADPQKNPVLKMVKGSPATLIKHNDQDYLQTEQGLLVELRREYPAHEILTQCQICITTVGANTAELAALGVPMVVLIPMQQLDAMRSWDGLPGILVRLPGVGSIFANLINGYILRQGRLFAWPNIWAKTEIVPELVGNLTAAQVGDLVIDYLDHPEKLQQMSDRLQQVRGLPGAAMKLAELVAEEMSSI